VPLTRDDARRLDDADPLAPLRERFVLPAGVIYLDGNSLGPLPRGTAERLRRVVEDEWGRDLIRSWTRHGWLDLPAAVAAKIAPLIGARPTEVAVADSTSVNLFKLLAAALALRPGRRAILSQPGNFPTDLYQIQGLTELLGDGHELRLAADPTAALDEDVAVVALSHVDYRRGEVQDMAAVTVAAHRRGALALWDLSHSAGALEVDLGGCGADLAVGGGYKYLNGGPGAPAYLFVAEALQEAARSPLQGWLGHADPFAFEPAYRPAPGIRRFLCGTPPVLSLAALDAGLDLFAGVDLAQVRRKSMALGDLFLRLVEERCGGHGLTPACPADARRRGSQVALAHPQGYAIVQALIARGVIGDFRVPDVLRFGLAPLFLRHVDVWDAVEHLRQVLVTGEYRQPEFQQLAPVT
jgi:kynureninase